MEKIEFTFLTEEQALGENQLDILKKYGTEAKMTDLARLSGGFADSWKLKEPFRYVNYRGSDGEMGFPYYTHYGARPATSYSSIAQNCTNPVRGENGILEVEYGEYPQYVAPSEIAEKLEQLYTANTIDKTGKSYTTHGFSNIDYLNIAHAEYEYDGKKYIRLEKDYKYNGSKLSDGTMIERGKAYWIEVSPIKWLVDEKANLVLSKYSLFSGIPYQYGSFSECAKDFKDSVIGTFLNTIFAKDVMPDFEKGLTPDTFLELYRLQNTLKVLQREKAELLEKEAEIEARIQQILSAADNIKTR